MRSKMEIKRDSRILQVKSRIEVATSESNIKIEEMFSEHCSARRKQWHGNYFQTNRNNEHVLDEFLWFYMLPTPASN